MIDALLFACVDEVTEARLGYDPQTLRVMPDGHPPPGCGDVFVAVHQAGSTSNMDNALNEYFAFSVTLTMRVKIGVDQVGDRLLALKLAQSTGFNRRAEHLRALLHMDWELLGRANNYLVEWNPDAVTVYGFCEPARYRGEMTPELVGGEWFAAEESEDVGLKAELRFEDARRLQAIETYL